MSHDVQTIQAKIDKAVSRIVLRAPFYAHEVMSKPIAMDATLNPPTAATDGTKTMLHPKAVEEWTVEELAGVLVHETVHNVLLHSFRRGNREPRKANMAMDYEVNPLVLEAGFVLPKGALVDPKYKGMAWEAIYNLLPDPPPDTPQFDEVRHAPGNASERARAEDEAKLRIKQAAMAAKAMGQLPAGMAHLVDAMLKPRVDWREELRRHMTAVLRNESSWRRFNRKFVAQGMYLPSMHNPGIGSIIVGIDTSGSIVERVSEFMAEVQAICDDVSPTSITVIQCDASVQAVDTYEPGDKLKAEAKGGGGTDLRKIYEVVANLSTPDVMVLLTDGETPWPEAPMYPHVTVTTSELCPFGENIKFV